MPAAPGLVANGTDESGLRLAVKGNAYLEEHEIPSFINDFIKVVLERRPADPLEFLISFAQEARASRTAAAGGHQVAARRNSKGQAPHKKGGREDSEKKAAPQSQGELGAAAAPERNRKIEQALLAVAVGAKGAIGPAVVNRTTAQQRTQSCLEALSGLVEEEEEEDEEEEEEEEGSLKYFQRKLQMLHAKSKKEEAKAEESVSDARARFAALVPELACRIAPELKRTEEAYRLALEEVERFEPGALAELETFAEALNEGPFVPGPAEVQVILAGKFDQDGHFIKDDTDTLRRMLLRAQIVPEAPPMAKGRRDSNRGQQSLSKTAPAKMTASVKSNPDVVHVNLFFEQDDVEEKYQAGFDSRPVEVPRCRVYGGQPGIKQPLPDNVQPTNVKALFAVYDLSEESLPILQNAVGQAVSDAEEDLRASSVEPHIKVKHAPLKAYERAAAKSAEKYKMNFSKLLDIARLTVVCRTLEEVVAVLHRLRASTMVRIVRMKNRVHPLFPADESAGYRDVLLNVIVVETGCVCEVQVTLEAFVNIKNTGGHGCYKIGRVIGIDRVDETTHQGTLSLDVMERVKAGLTQRLRLEGTAIPQNLRSTLVGANCLAAEHVRLLELRMGACKGLAGFDVEALLSDGVCRALGNTIRVIDLTATGIRGNLEHIPLSTYCHRLDTLLMGDNKLVGGIPKSFCKLHQLRELKLFGNDLKGKLPPQLGELHSLEVLELYDCGLSGKIPRELGNMRRLQVLTLCANKLSGSIPEEIGNLVAVRGLYLHTNKLTGVIPDSLGNLRCCRILSIYANRFSGNIPLHLADASMLKKVSLPGGLRNQAAFEAKFRSNHLESTLEFHKDEDDDDEEEEEDHDEEHDEGEDEEEEEGTDEDE